MFKMTKEKYEQVNIFFDQIRKIAIGFTMLPIFVWIAAILIKQQFIIYKPFFVIIVINLGLLINVNIIDYILRQNIDDKTTNKKKEND